MKHRLFWEDWLSGWSGIILKSHSPYIVKSESKVHFSSFSFVTFTFTFSFVILINISINRGLYRTWRNQKKPTSMKYHPMWGIWYYLLLFRHMNSMKIYGQVWNITLCEASGIIYSFSATSMQQRWKRQQRGLQVAWW